MPVNLDRSLRLPESEYFAESVPKSGIALHHTVSDSAHTTLDIWSHDSTPGGGARRVATAFVIERDGTVYESFDPAAWAWQFGLSWPRENRVRFEKRFIGIELTSEGGLTEHEGKLYAFGLVSPWFEKPVAEALDCDAPYRGYRWFDRYESAQLISLGFLVDDLCTRFHIPRVYPDSPYAYYGRALESFEGVIGHAMVRSDKSDPAPDPRLWETLEILADLRPTSVPPAGPRAAAAPSLSGTEAEALFESNARRLNRLDVAAGSLVKALLMELERRRVFLQLITPAPDSHSIEYDVVRGDASLVARLAKQFGFENVTDRRLQVRHA